MSRTTQTGDAELEKLQYETFAPRRLVNIPCAAALTRAP